MGTSDQSMFKDVQTQFLVLTEAVVPVQRLLEAHAIALLFSERDRIDRTESRTKSFSSIQENYLRDRGSPRSSVTLDEFLKEVEDFVGIRIVVYYSEDVDIISDALVKAYPTSRLDEKLTIHDVNRGSRFGYRAVHVNFLFEDQLILSPTGRAAIGIEFQIRTILSDAWARHSHKLIYKHTGPLHP